MGPAETGRGPRQHLSALLRTEAGGRERVCPHTGHLTKRPRGVGAQQASTAALPRSSEEQLRRAYHLLMAQLSREHAEVRLSAFQVIDQLFARSHQFRVLVVSNFQEFLELTLGTDHEQPLPPPREAARRLRQAAARAVQGWHGKYGAAYKKLALGYHFLRHSQQVGRACLASRCRPAWWRGSREGTAALSGGRVDGAEPPVLTSMGSGNEGKESAARTRPCSVAPSLSPARVCCGLWRSWLRETCRAGPSSLAAPASARAAGRSPCSLNVLLLVRGPRAHAAFPRGVCFAGSAAGPDPVGGQSLPMSAEVLRHGAPGAQRAVCRCRHAFFWVSV